MTESIAPDKLIEIHRLMLRIRRFEERGAYLYEKQEVPGLLHLYIGQEAVAAGVSAALSPDDYITSTHRGHGHVVARGADFSGMLAELYGKATGLCKGKGGSMHIADVSRGILGANGILGAGIPIAAGAALRAKYDRTNQVAVTFFGDGAANEGTLSETLNLASIWKLPLIFVCENNRYTEFTHSVELSAGRIADRALGYGMPGVAVDGQDALAVYLASREAVARAQAGEGPTLIEAMTLRFYGHSEGEEVFLGRAYRPEGEAREWMKDDPIVRLQTKLVAEGLLAPDQIETLETQIAAELDDATEFARQSPYPAPEDALLDQFA